MSKGKTKPDKFGQIYMILNPTFCLMDLFRVSLIFTTQFHSKLMHDFAEHLEISSGIPIVFWIVILYGIGIWYSWNAAVFQDKHEVQTLREVREIFRVLDLFLPLDDEAVDQEDQFVIAKFQVG